MHVDLTLQFLPVIVTADGCHVFRNGMAPDSAATRLERSSKVALRPEMYSRSRQNNEQT
jgi:hypothetical protein